MNTGRILQAARKHAKMYVTRGGFQEVITLSTPDKMTSITVTGYATKHHIGIDTDGLPVNTKNVHIALNEDDLVAQNYPVRNNKQEVRLRTHLVDVVDSTGIVKNYVINEVFPDETLGLIVCVLGDYIT